MQAHFLVSITKQTTPRRHFRAIAMKQSCHPFSKSPLFSLSPSCRILKCAFVSGESVVIGIDSTVKSRDHCSCFLCSLINRSIWSNKRDVASIFVCHIAGEYHYRHPLSAIETISLFLDLMDCMKHFDDIRHKCRSKAGNWAETAWRIWNESLNLWKSYKHRRNSYISYS